MEIEGPRRDLIDRNNLQAAIDRPDDVYDEVRAERDRQDVQWGGPSHDDEHWPHDWNALVDTFNDRAKAALDSSYSMRGIARDEWRRRMIQVAALAVAAVERYDRAPD